GMAKDAMFDHTASLRWLFIIWFATTIIIGVFIFCLGRLSKEWNGWDYIFYGKPIYEGVDDWMSFSELREYAKSKGWMQGIKEGIQEAFDLNNGIGDAVSKGYIEIIGRYNPQRDTNLNDIYPCKIPQEHWRDHYIDSQSVLIGYRSSEYAVTKPKLR